LRVSFHGAALFSALLAKMFGANLRCGEEAEEGDSGGCGFNGWTAVSFFALDNADDGGYGHACFASGFNGVDGGGAGGANVVDNDDANAGTAEPFNAAAGAVSLLGFANEKAVEERRGGVGLGSPGACGGYVGDDGVRAKRESADCFCVDVILIEKLKNGVAGKASAFCVESGGAAVDVIVARAAGGELELAEAEADAGEKGEKLLGVGGHH